MAKAKSKAQFSAPTNENPEWTDDTFKRARPVEDLLPPEIASQFAKRGRPKAAVKKVPVSLRLSNDVVEKFKATIGPGWQTAIDDLLKTVKVTKKGGARHAAFSLKQGPKYEVIVHGQRGKPQQGAKKTA